MKNLSKEIRLETLRMLKKRGFGHIGGSLSIVETLSVLYGDIMNIDPSNPDWDERDYIVLSKGHAGPALYSTLAIKGYFDKDMLLTLNNNGTRLPSHCDRLLTPGIDMTTGSLGQGISSAVGIAMALKLEGKENRVFTIVGDGEMNEGQVYEAIQFAYHQKLDNLVIFIDENKLQLDGYTKDILDQGDMVKKMQGFGLDTVRVDGHNELNIKEAIERALAKKGVPSCIVLDTVKSKGFVTLENNTGNHHVRFSDEQNKELDRVMAELEEALR